jgi:hypothetical protein
VVALPLHQELLDELGHAPPSLRRYKSCIAAVSAAAFEKSGAASALAARVRLRIIRVRGLRAAKLPPPLLLKPLEARAVRLELEVLKPDPV